MRGKRLVCTERVAAVAVAFFVIWTVLAATASAEWIEQAKLAAGDGVASDRFGIRLDLQGETALIGASFDNAKVGSAYVFTGSGATWTQSQQLTAGDGAVNNYFGSSVALDGDVAIIGASGANAAYIFENQAGTWTKTQKLTTPGYTTFGGCVDLEGTTAVVGLISGNPGAAYVYNYDGGTSTWSLAQTLVGPSVSRDFGVSVDLDGARLIVGDKRYTGTATYQGAGIVYEYNSGTSTWDYVATLAASDPAVSDYMGTSVALDGDLAAVGSFYDDDLGTDSGSVYLFEADEEGNWAQVAKLTGSDINALDYFGGAVALKDGVLMVGAYNTDNGGATYVFEKIGGTWTQTAKLTGSNTAVGDSFGIAIAMDGATALIGAFAGDGNAADTGAAYVFIVPEPAAATLLVLGGLSLVMLLFHNSRKQ